MAIGRFFTKSITLRPKNRAANTDANYDERQYGGHILAPGTETTVMGAIFSMNPHEREMWGRQGIDVDHVFILPTGTTVLADSEAVYGGKLFDLQPPVIPGEMTAAQTPCAHVRVIGKYVGRAG